MRRNLFSLETGSQDSSGNDLLIDKLLDKKKEEVSPLSLTADLLKKREEITKEVEDQLEDDDKDSKSSSDDASSSDDDNPDQDKGEGDDDSEGDSKASENEDKTEDKEDPKEDKESKKDEDDEGSEADSEEDLEASMGSELDKEDTEEKKEEEVTKENFKEPKTRSPRVNLSKIFSPLRDTHSKYLVTLESMGGVGKPTEATEQPVAYVKEAVLESIKNLTTVAYSYIESNNSFSNKIKDGLLNVNERITVFGKLVEARKYHFTHKLVSDRDILSNISYKEHSDLRETTRAMANYLHKSNTSASTILNSEFDDLKSGFLTQDFIEDGEDLVYSKPIPGFNLVKVATVPYTNYLKTKLEDFQYYKMKVMKAEDLYGLPAISLTEDKDIDYVMENLAKLVLSTTVAVDTLKGVTDNFTKFVDELKVIAYNVQNDEFKNLSELGLDEKIQGFIRFKLVMEISYININLVIDYITSVMSALNVVVELKQDSSDSGTEDDSGESEE